MSVGWNALLNKVATKDNIHSRGIKLESTTCVLCHGDMEIVNHLIFRCSITCVESML